MRKYYLLLCILSLAHHCYGQKLFFFGFNYQLINAYGLHTVDDKPGGLELGCLLPSESILGIYASLNVDAWDYKNHTFLTAITPDSKYGDSRTATIRSTSFSAGIGPSLKAAIGEDFRIRINACYQISHQKATATYSILKEHLLPIGNNKFITDRTEIIYREKDQKMASSSYLRIKLGIDMAAIGAEIGWQGLNYGKTMNALDPTPKFLNEKINTRTSIAFAGLVLRF